VVRGDMFHHVCRNRGRGSCSHAVQLAYCMCLIGACVFPHVLHMSVVFRVVRRRVPWCGIILSGRRTQTNNNVGRLELIKRHSGDYDSFAFSFAEYASASLPILIISQRRTITTAVSSIVGISPKPTTKCAGGIASFTPTDSILIVHVRTAQ
jgi:hypothetical protein